MDLKSIDSKYKRVLIATIGIALTFIIVLGVISVLFPSVMWIVLKLFWGCLLCIVMLVFLLAVLIIFGMKNEAKEVLSLVLDGSLKLIDLTEFIKDLGKKSLLLIQKIIWHSLPLLGILTSGLIYIGLLLLYKLVGAHYDVTLLTVVLSIVVTIFTGYLNRPSASYSNGKTWGEKAGKRFSHIFRDSMEVFVFIFFLTMDSTWLYFLPSNLNIPVYAEMGSYDLMKRGIVFDKTFYITLSFIIVSVTIEILRRMLHIVVYGGKLYKKIANKATKEGKTYKAAALVKWALKESYYANMDDLIKFLVFTSVLTTVFLFFPRLKLLAMAVVSVTSLVLDIIMPSRLTVAKKDDDLISKIIVKVFRL